MDHLPQLSEKEHNVRPSRSPLASRAKLTIALVATLLLVMIVLHLTGVINESNVGH
jgi:hypothetical protein